MVDDVLMHHDLICCCDRLVSRGLLDSSLLKLLRDRLSELLITLSECRRGSECAQADCKQDGKIQGGPGLDAWMGSHVRVVAEGDCLG